MVWNRRSDLPEQVNNKGVTTIVVVCAMVIIMALSFSLFLTASVMMQESGKTAAKEQSRILALSLCRQLQRQLTGEEEPQADSLLYYVNRNISEGTWPCYDGQEKALYDREDVIRSFAMDSEGVAGEIAETEISLYWMKEEAGEASIQLVVETSVTVKGQTYVVRDTYEADGSGEDFEVWRWKHIDRR